jgi:thiamine-phosphate pyrophosphorylase
MGEPLGLEALALGPHPGRLVAVGGIDGPARARAARAAGADAIATIRAIWDAVDPAAAVAALVAATTGDRGVVNAPPS